MENFFWFFQTNSNSNFPIETKSDRFRPNRKKSEYNNPTECPTILETRPKRTKWRASSKIVPNQSIQSKSFKTEKINIGRKRVLTVSFSNHRPKKKLLHDERISGRKNFSSSKCSIIVIFPNESNWSTILKDNVNNKANGNPFGYYPFGNPFLATRGLPFWLFWYKCLMLQSNEPLPLILPVTTFEQSHLLGDTFSGV